MRKEVVDQICEGAPSVQAARARTLIKGRGNLIDDLVAIGFAVADVVQACAQVTGIPPAKPHWLKNPKPGAGVDAALCRKLGAAPIASSSGRLCIAYSDPETAVQHATLGLPPHQPYLASSSELANAFALLTEDGAAAGDSEADMEWADVVPPAATRAPAPVPVAAAPKQRPSPTPVEAVLPARSKEALDVPVVPVAPPARAAVPAPQVRTAVPAPEVRARSPIEEPASWDDVEREPSRPNASSRGGFQVTASSATAPVARPVVQPAGASAAALRGAPRSGAESNSQRSSGPLDPPIELPKAASSPSKPAEASGVKPPPPTELSNPSSTAAQRPRERPASKGKLPASSRAPRDDASFARISMWGGLAVALLILVIAVFAPGDKEASQSSDDVDAAEASIGADVKARQLDMTAKGNAEIETMKAILIFDEAIALAPAARSASGALLGRARCFLALGNLEAALQDLAVLKKRKNLGVLEDEVEELSAQVYETRKKRR